MKLHVGCGSTYKKGFVNIDVFDGAVADCLADALQLPFPDHSAERIESYQLIEHLGFFGAFYHLAECYRVLDPDGVLVLETPDPEASFEKFLRCETKKDRGEALNWIFGHSCDGYAHRFLFPEDALREILARSGFTAPAFEQARSHLYAPGLRVVCTKNGEGIFSVLSRLRRSVTPPGTRTLPNQVELVEFEERFVASALALEERQEEQPSNGPMDRLVEMIVLSPRLALEFVDAVETWNVPLAMDVRNYRPCLEWLVSAGFTSTLFAAFHRLADRPNLVTDGYDHLLEQGRTFVRDLLEGRRPQADTSLTDAFDLPPAQRPPSRADGLFSRWRVTVEARRFRDLGIKHLCRDELPQAERLLARSINSKVEYFYSVWNMAILKARTGDLDEAVEYYKLALRFEVPGTTSVLRKELALLLLHARRDRQGAGSDLRDRPPLPAIRSEPVLVGDYVYAQP